MQKHLAMINGDRVHDIVVAPGTTPIDVRNSLNLPADFMLTRRDGLPFGDREDIFGIVHEGEKLYASAPANVGIGRFPSSAPGKEAARVAPR